MQVTQLGSYLKNLLKHMKILSLSLFECFFWVQSRQWWEMVCTHILFWDGIIMQSHLLAQFQEIIK